jgi:hypothetical protein
VSRHREAILRRRRHFAVVVSLSLPSCQPAAVAEGGALTLVARRAQLSAMKHQLEHRVCLMVAAPAASTIREHHPDRPGPRRPGGKGRDPKSEAACEPGDPMCEL